MLPSAKEADLLTFQLDKLVEELDKSIVDMMQNLKHWALSNNELARRVKQLQQLQAQHKGIKAHRSAKDRRDYKRELEVARSVSVMGKVLFDRTSEKHGIAIQFRRRPVRYRECMLHVYGVTALAGKMLTD